ncbi:helix-turn-helix transcriptional regulator [Pseudoponticoccus marisrubri]|uniref:HTH luxR-type domain-containing protein n=1 Tax=Pseudoponticoccus marisrubri TaxID=1685382 RepID=A0A0W7WN84_9RHOB|nr:LuxR C-terminal-related transcriptional regulator [Pseudoponticoccus marisrubri]KUF12061.1 hypothetical protein AVJ23_05670 [Pseudoponticoccus marisrubri]
MTQRIAPTRAGAALRLPTLLQDSLHQLEDAQSPEGVWTAFLDLARPLGLDVVHYVYAADLRDPAGRQFLRSTLARRWQDALRRHPGLAPAAQDARALTPRLIGTALSGPAPVTDRRVAADALCAEMGLEAGLVLPLPARDPGQAALILFGGRLSRPAFESLLASHGWALHAAALSGHARHGELLRRAFETRCGLTPKQRDLIRLVGEGLMDKQIAHSLDISFSAVRQRLACVQQKTGAQTRSELAALAMRLGLVGDPLLRAQAAHLADPETLGAGDSAEMCHPEPLTRTAAE